MHVTTVRGSTYVIGPSPRRHYLQVARLSDHAVSARGREGRHTFAEDFTHVEVVSDGAHLRLMCTRETGQHLRTSPIAEVVAEPSALVDTQQPLTRTAPSR